MKLDLDQLQTPCYAVDEALLERNLTILADVQAQSGATIILALKGFAMFSLFPLIRRYLRGTTASSVDEARLGFEEFGGEVHVCAPAYSDRDIAELLPRADHIVFNSFSQWKKYRPVMEKAQRKISCGLRVNPEYSEVETEIYDPCAPCSRLGIPAAHFEAEALDGIEGLHFHALCEQNSDTLERTLSVVEQKFGDYFGRLKWINFGGGHHITRPDYDRERLCNVTTRFRERHGLQVYLEPGEAIALGTGYLVASVLDIVHNGMAIAILDTSATAHMPDVLEMPYRPEVEGAGEPGRFPYTYRLGGLTCLAGDRIGDYSFPHPLEVGSKLVFHDMAHYTMVKNTTFNGVRLPSIYRFNSATGEYSLVREFGYEDYKNRLS